MTAALEAQGGRLELLHDVQHPVTVVVVVEEEGMVAQVVVERRGQALWERHGKGRTIIGVDNVMVSV